MTAPEPAVRSAPDLRTPSFTVLFVCTGNICRSPIAERLLQARLAPAQRAKIRSVSAGLRAVSGYPMDPLAAEVLRRLGGDSGGHIARQISGLMVHDADLVLTASTEHRARIVRDYPATMRRVFTMREFARLGNELRALRTGTPLSARVGAVAAQRGIAEAVDPVQDEIGDPFGASAEVMWECGEMVAEAVGAVVRILALD